MSRYLKVGVKLLAPPRRLHSVKYALNPRPIPGIGGGGVGGGWGFQLTSALFDTVNVKYQQSK